MGADTRFEHTYGILFLINIFYCVFGMHNVIVYVVTVSTFYLYFGYLLRMTD